MVEWKEFNPRKSSAPEGFDRWAPGDCVYMIEDYVEISVCVPKNSKGTIKGINRTNGLVDVSWFNPDIPESAFFYYRLRRIVPHGIFSLKGKRKLEL